MKLLENELIQKYFGCNECRDHLRISESADRHTSQRILQGMCEPIKKGEKFIELYNDDREPSLETLDEGPFNEFHPFFLRLPDKFQQRDLVEQKIDQIMTARGDMSISSGLGLRCLLRELVELARKQ